MKPIQTALISVFDKKGLIPFAKGLRELRIQLISTGRTAEALRKAGVACTDVSEITHFPEMLDGRVKTLHPMLHGGILADRSKPEHLEVLKKFGIREIDLVVVNLYPFQETLKQTNDHGRIIEMIDIGGPAMLRAAAKNFASVTPVCDIGDYSRIIRDLKKNKRLLSPALRQGLAAKVFEHTAAYDASVARYLSGDSGKTLPGGLPLEMNVRLRKIVDLRYGENPHQRAALYKSVDERSEGLPAAQVLGGKQLSFNNYLDMESAWSVVRNFKDIASCVIKHTSPCGIALGKTPAQAFKDAFACDSLSAFGGIVGFNRRVDRAAARVVFDAGFLECVVAPDFMPDALKILKEKKNLRLVKVSLTAQGPHLDYKRLRGGLLVQDTDVRDVVKSELKAATKRKPTPHQIRDMIFAFTLCRFVKSNTIVLVKNLKTVGIGSGQPSRVDSAIHAFRKAGSRARGAVMASDGFFPKPDTIELAAKNGIRAIIQPGGSIQDKAVIAACDQAKIPMVLTGIRHFSH